ncbi:DUF202 domain-containing protein [Klebsiella pneumoniae]|nr:DUF202 domain-containing protein [Klebsiella pneumoniae]
MKARYGLVDGNSSIPLNAIPLPSNLCRQGELLRRRNPTTIRHRCGQQPAPSTDKNEQPAASELHLLTTRLQHLTLDALKNGLYSMLENNNENIESFRDVITAEMPTERRLSHSHIDTREPLLVKTRKGYNDRGNWGGIQHREAYCVATNILLRIVDELADTGKDPDYRFSANERTFLAWIRTALAFMAAAIGIDQLAEKSGASMVKELLVCALLGITAATSRGTPIFAGPGMNAPCAMTRR